MRKRTPSETENAPLAVDTMTLAQMLSCGRATAVKVGTAAGARIEIGRRVLWSVAKVNAHLAEIAS